MKGAALGSLAVVGREEAREETEAETEAEAPPCEPWCSPERVAMGEVSGGQGREHPRMSTIKFRC